VYVCGYELQTNLQNFTQKYLTTAPSLPFSITLTLDNIVTLQTTLEVTQGHWKWHHSMDRIRLPIRLPL